MTATRPTPVGGAALRWFDTKNYGAKSDLTREDSNMTSGSAAVTGTSFQGTTIDSGKLIRVQGAGASIANGTDGAMSSASVATQNLFTSAGASFTSAVIGRWITVSGADTAGTTMKARIFGVASSTTLRLSRPCRVTVTGATWRVSEDLYTTISTSVAGVSAVLGTTASTSVTDAIIFYGTDDSTAIQAAVTACEAASGNGGVVYHYGPSGIGAPIFLQKPTQFIGAGSRGYSSTIGHGTSRLMLLRAKISGIVAAPTSFQMGTRGAMSSSVSPTVLTDAAGQFVVGDVGKNIIVYGAGTQSGSGSQAHLNTTISGYTSATQVTLTAAATTTVTSALYTYGTGSGYQDNFAVGPVVRNIHVEGGPGQLAGIHLINCSESILDEVCCSEFTSGVAIYDDGGPSAGFGNQNELRSVYALDSMIGIRQTRGAIQLTGNIYIDGSSNRVDCKSVGTFGIDAQCCDASSATIGIQAIETAVRISGQGGASGLWGRGFTIEGCEVGFDIASDGSDGSKGMNFGFVAIGASNSGGGYGLKLRSSVTNAEFHPGYYLDSDVDMWSQCDATALQALVVPRHKVVKAGTISDADFPNVPIDGAIGIDTLNNHIETRIGGSWKYAALNGLASRVKKIHNAQGDSVTTLTLTCSGSTIPVGHHVVVAIGFGLGSTPSVAVTDSKSNSYTTNIEADLLTAPTAHAAIATAKVTTPLVAGDTITVTFGSAPGLSDALAYEFTGVASASHVDQTAGATGTSTSPSSGNITTTLASEALIGVVYNAAATCTAGTGWTVVDTQDNVGAKRLTVLEQDVFATGTYAATATLSSSVVWAMVVASLKAA